MDGSETAGMSLDDSIDSVVASLTAAPDEVSQQRGMISGLFSIVFQIVGSCVSFSLWWLKKIVFFLPRWLFSFLQISFQVTLSLKWILLLIAITLIALSMIVRYKYLTVYSKFLEEPDIKDPNLNMLIDSRTKKKDARFPNFLDGFLSAIKIFGYLDKNVFHELTKNMTTQKLEKYETFVVDEAKGFSIVVDGTVQLYCKTRSESQHIQSLDEKDSEETLLVDGVRYQLLNIVKSGTTLSSLVSILRIFTNNFESPLDASVISQENIERLNRNMAASPNNFPSLNTATGSPALANFQLDGSPTPPGDINSQHDSNYSSQVKEALLPPLIARASSNATIAIIPNEAFARIVQKHPRSVSHIVQMIMARLHRVTFQTAHSYLGLTGEIYQTEVNLNNNAKYELPSYLHHGVIQRLNLLLANDTTNSSTLSSPWKPSTSSAIDEGISPKDSTAASMMSPSTSNLSSKASTSVFSDDGGDDAFISMPSSSRNRKASRPDLLRNTKWNKSRNIILNTRSAANPGDLLSNVPLSRKELTYQSLTNTNIDENEVFERTFSADEETEDSSLRTAISESVLKILGVDKNSLGISSRKASDTEVSSPLFHGVNSSEAMQSLSTTLGSSHRKFSNGSSSSLYAVIGFKGSSSTLSDDGNSLFAANREPPLDFDNLKKELADKLQIMLVKKDIKIVQENQRTPGLYYVIDGTLEVSHSTDKNQETKLYTIKPGEVAGYLGTFIGNNSFINVKTLTDLYVGFISKDDFEQFLDKYYMLQLIVARNTIKFMDKELLLMDLALEWVQTQAGESLYDQGDPANGIYMVLNGRFRSFLESNPQNSEFSKNGEDENNQMTIISEYGQGESLGEVEVLTASERPTTMIAVRDSESARIPRTLFEILALTKPSIMIKVTRIVARKMKESSTLGSLRSSAMFDATTNHRNPTISALPSPLNSGSSTNYRTITILPVRQGLPVTEFAEKLSRAFKSCDRDVITLNQASTVSHLGRHAFDKLAKLKQSGFFADLEEKYETVIYVTDTPVSSRWTQTAISQGDCILLLADADSSPDVGDYERLLVKTKTTARTDLILLHADRYVKPGQTNKWLKRRLWVHSHHHVQMQFKEGFSKLPTDDVLSFIPSSFKTNKVIKQSSAKIANIKSRVGSIIKDDIFKRIPAIDFTKLEEVEENPSRYHKSDFLRLARILSGNAVGLVLGGGGSRGISHIGIIKALEEGGIPIDMVGGTSIGAFIGGLYARDYDIVPIYGRAKRFSGRISSFWRMLSDVTYPVTSYITGHEFNRGIWKAFGDSRIEDFWVSYFTNSTNITNSMMEIHSSGYAWRYIRASMSLAGLLPPLTDNGSMLLDGGYIDNLPVEEMKQRGASVIFAVDVGSVDDRTPLNYGDSLSGLWVIFNRWNPFSKHPNVPTMAEIQLRLTYVASVNALEKAKRTPGVIYLRPPIEQFSTLDFGRFEEIYKVGEAYGTMIVKELEEKGELPLIKGVSNKPKERYRRVVERRNSI